MRGQKPRVSARGFEILRSSIEEIGKVEKGQISRKQAHTLVDRYYDAKEDLERIHREFRRIREIYLGAIGRTMELKASSIVAERKRKKGRKRALSL